MMAMLLKVMAVTMLATIIACIPNKILFGFVDSKQVIRSAVIFSISLLVLVMLHEKLYKKLVYS